MNADEGNCVEECVSTNCPVAVAVVEAGKVIVWELDPAVGVIVVIVVSEAVVEARYETVIDEVVPENVNPNVPDAPASIVEGKVMEEIAAVGDVVHVEPDQPFTHEQL